MFDASLCAAADLRQMGDLCRQLVEAHLEELRRLGHARDIEFLFFANDPCRPNWEFVNDIDEEAQRIVREIFANAHDVARAEATAPLSSTNDKGDIVGFFSDGTHVNGFVQFNAPVGPQ